MYTMISSRLPAEDNESEIIEDPIILISELIPVNKFDTCSWVKKLFSP